MSEKVAVARYIWELPVRWSHWINVFSITLLSVTGLYIGAPDLIGVSVDSLLMDKMRLVHFVTAFVFTLSVLVRIVWFFVGNEHAGWRSFIPTKLQDFHLIKEQFLYYIFLRWDPPYTPGHNRLATLAYIFVFGLYVVQILTGFALYTISSDPAVAGLFSWVFSCFGGSSYTRLGHHLIMWLLIGFAIHHVYSALLIDIEERNGLISSIITGWKFLRPEK